MRGCVRVWRSAFGCCSGFIRSNAQIGNFVLGARRRIVCARQTNAPAPGRYFTYRLATAFSRPFSVLRIASPEPRIACSIFTYDTTMKTSDSEFSSMNMAAEYSQPWRLRCVRVRRVRLMSVNVFFLSVLSN